MIAPTYRLIIWAALVVLLFSVPIAATALTPFYLGLVLLFTVLVCLDGFLSLNRFDGIRVDLPEVVRMSQGRPAEISILLKNEKKKFRQIRLGLPLPVEIHSSEPGLLVNLSRNSSTSSISWPCTPQKQGRYSLDRYYLQTSSPLGFWSIRSGGTGRTEFRVYPNLFVDRKNLAALFLHRRLGLHTARQIGKGREFEQLREYQSGDSFEDIHWKATAKRNFPVTKIYQIERTQEVYVIIDHSRLSSRTMSPGRKQNGPVAETTILERFISSALILGLVTERQGDLFGLITFCDRVRGFVRAKSGRPHFNACRDSLYQLEPLDVSPDFAELFTFIGTRIRRRALLILLTSLDDPVLAEEFIRPVNMIAGKHLVLVNMPRPAPARPLFSPAPVETGDDLYQYLGGHIILEGLRKIERSLKSRGIGFSLLNSEKLSAQLVSQYLNIKQKQMI